MVDGVEAELHGPQSARLGGEKHGVFAGISLSRLSVLSSGSSAFYGEDAAELEKAALEKVFAPKLAAKKAVLFRGPDGRWKVIDVNNLRAGQAQVLIDKMAASAGEAQASQAEPFVKAVRKRFDTVGVRLPSVVVRFKDLTVRVQGRQGPLQRLVPSRCAPRPAAPLLDGVSGSLHPGRFTLLLGPPGAGKTTLMRALSGQLKSEGNLEVSAAELTYNGTPLGGFVVERVAAYCSQVDVHIPELTVRETFDFSARCQGPSTISEANALVRDREREQGITPDHDAEAYMKAVEMAGKQSVKAQLFLRLLGLEGCADTVVGDAMLRGISGGQKKRVTTGEAMVGSMGAFYADEISTGLDSSTTYEICRSLRTAAHLLDSVLVVALLQPSPETVDLFDDILLLAEGRVVYHGPTQEAMPFFESLGFACPPISGLADFLQGVTTPTDQQRYWAGEPGGYTYLSPADIAAHFAETPAGAASAAELALPFQADQEQDIEPLVQARYGRPGRALLRALLSRGWVLQARTLPFYVIRVFQTIVVGFVIGTL